jgi:hypothetical protein
MALQREGALAPAGADMFVLSPAGRARQRRGCAEPHEQFLAQHAPIAPRPLIAPEGEIDFGRGLEPGGAMARLARLRDAAGAAFFSPAEIAAGAQLSADWSEGQLGLLRGTDWAAPPRGSAPRGAGAEPGLVRAIEARRRVERAFATLAPLTARLVRAACLDETGLEAIEREAHWPARSAKVALKLGLAQLAQHYRRG